jgi:hypothetical protein
MSRRILLSLILTLSAFPLAGRAQSKEQREHCESAIHGERT